MTAAGGLHSFIRPRQFILPVTQITSDAARHDQHARRAFAVSPPPYESGPPVPNSYGRSLPTKRPATSIPLVSVRRFDSSRRCGIARQPFRRCLIPVPGTTPKRQTELDCLAESPLTSRSLLRSGHTPPVRRLKHASDQLAHREPTRKPHRFLR